MVEAYLKGRQTLRLVVFLLDIRRDPGEQDLSLGPWFEFYRIPYVIALTKVDKISRQQIIRRRESILQALGKPPRPAVLFSARTGAGKEDLWQVMDKYLFPFPAIKLDSPI